MSISPKSEPAGFDRLRHRSPNRPRRDARLDQQDADGRRALFSPSPVTGSQAAFGSVSIECSRCRKVSTLSAVQAMKAATPSVALPLLRGKFCWWMRCPACQQRTWVSLRVNL